MYRSQRAALSRLLSSTLFISGLAIPAMLCAPARAADDAAAPSVGAPPEAPAPPSASPQERQLRNDVDAYFHYAWIGRYDLATQFGQKSVDESDDPAALIPILESIASLHDKSMGYMAQLLLFDNQADLKDVTDKLLLKVQAGNVARSQNPELIAKTIRDMSVNERAYENNLPALRRSGELAIPIMLQFLQNPDADHKPYRGTVRRAMLDMGKSALNPLLAATEMKDYDTLLTVIDTLGSLGYDISAPYLARLSNDSTLPDTVRNAAGSALGRLQIKAGESTDPAQMYYDLAQRFYYDETQLAQVIDNPGTSPGSPIRTCNYWTYDADKGLVRVEVPAEIFDDLMSQRTCESALTLKADMPEAVSLWLDADNAREVNLPSGDTDPVRGNAPPAHFFNVSSGARHLDDALARALKDRNSAVAFKLTRSLGLIIGRSSMSGRIGEPITDALRYPDKRVRYEAACALATSLPTKPFADEELVVPILVQAIGEGGQGNVVVLGPTMDDANALQDTLRKAGYLTAAASTPGEAVTAALNLPSVDAIVVARGTSDEDIDRTLDLARKTPNLEVAVEVVLKEAATGQIATAALSNPLLSITTETDGDKLKAAIDAARAKSGLSPLAPGEADTYALRAAAALESLALSESSVLPAAVGQSGLLSALDSPKPDLVSAVGRVLSHLPSAEAEQGLAQRALDDQAAAPVRISLFQSLTTSAKSHGNQLDPAQVALLTREAVEIKDNDLRSAAAEARGALNLPTDVARDLILNQGQ